MKCYGPDVGELGLAFYMTWNPSRAASTFGRLAETIRYYDRYLDQYPAVMVEHLEPVYSLARGLGAFDATFLSIQLTDLGGWHGIVSGGIYALLSPDNSLLDSLATVEVNNHPENLWACSCAIADLKNERWPEDCRSVEPSIMTIRDAVKRLGFPETPIRRELDAAEVLQFEEFRDFTRKMYRDHGVAGARTAIRERVEYQWIVSHSQWVQVFANQDDCESLYRRQ